MKIIAQTEINTIRLIYTNVGVLLEFWRYFDRSEMIQPRSTYLLTDFNKISNLMERLYRKYGEPFRIKVYPSGNIYISFLVYDKSR